MKKKVLTAALALALSAGICGSVYASETVLKIGDNIMTVNGEAQTIDTAPVIIESRTLVPIRAIVEALDGNVDWDNETKTATLTNSNGDEVKLTINSRTASYNGVESELDTPPVIINERTMLPIRYVAESFGYKTDWNAADKSITISDGEGGSEAETKQTSFDLSGHSEEHFASDVNGNEYTYFSDEDDMYDKYIVVKDKNGNDKGAYKLTYAWGNVYKDNGGNIFTLVYDNNVAIYSAVINGTEIELALNDEYYLIDKEGNVYDNFEDDKITVKDKNGNVTATYSNTGEMWEVYEDENGNKAYVVYRRDGGYKNGFIIPDGKYEEFELNFDTSFMGSDGRIYSTPYEYIIVADENYNVIDEWKSIPDSTDAISVGEDGTEYIVTGDFAESYTLKSADKTVNLTCDPEEEHNKKLFAKGEYGSEDAIYYSGDDGKTYVSKDFIFTVYGTDGKAEDKIAMQRYEEKYRSSDGKTYIYAYVYDEERSYIKADGEIIELDMIMG